MAKPMPNFIPTSLPTPKLNYLRRHFIALFMTLAVLGWVQSVSAHEDDPLHTMASIMSHLEHYPSDSEKKTLMGISKSSTASANAKTLATAMINLQHHVSDSDKPKLEAIVADAKASDNEKAMANIILHLSHMPSATDKAALSKM